MLLILSLVVVEGGSLGSWDPGCFCLFDVNSGVLKKQTSFLTVVYCLFVGDKGWSPQDTWRWHAISILGAYKHAARGCIVISHYSSSYSEVESETTTFTYPGQQGRATTWTSPLCLELIRTSCYLRQHWCIRTKERSTTITKMACDHSSDSRYQGNIKSGSVRAGYKRMTTTGCNPAHLGFIVHDWNRRLSNTAAGTRNKELK